MKKILSAVLTATMVFGIAGAASTVFAEFGTYSDDYYAGYEAGYQAGYEDRYDYYEDDYYGDSWGESDGYYDDYDEYDYYDDDYGYGDSEGDSWGDDDTYHSNDKQVDESELMTWNTGIGSAGELDGNIVVVSIYVNDSKTSWNFSNSTDISTREDTLEYLIMATDWISKQGNTWGSNPVFICDWENNDGLYYETSVNSDVTSEDEDEDPYMDICEYIQKNIDSDALLKKYDAESIVYMTYYNTSYRNDYVSYTYPYDDTMEYPYEICFILVHSDNEDEAPAAYAHEMLHTFGAPDLYTSESPEYNYNIVNDFVEYCETYYANEIMLTTYDVDTNDAHYDKITNELTRLTAYYVGWIDECEEVEEFNLQKSQYVLTGR